MTQTIGFDIISDLNLGANDKFDWSDKATSLYCIVAGNISDDIKTLARVLFTLSTKYYGVFFVPGKLEYSDTLEYKKRTDELTILCDNIDNVTFLYNSIVTVDSVAIIGANGWGDIPNEVSTTSLLMNSVKYQDYLYLEQSIKKLQRHPDVKKIILVTSGVPKEDLYFGEMSKDVVDHTPLIQALSEDTEKKVTSWVFGTYPKTVDVFNDYVQFISNPKTHVNIYWAKRLEISV
jgi:hypothetical protein